jgi:hypothetical protein
MATLEITTQPHSTTTRISALLAFHNANPIPVSPLVAAQRAGDAEYDAVLELTHDGQRAAIAYHSAYQRLARRPGGCGPVCECETCQP